MNNNAATTETRMTDAELTALENLVSGLKKHNSRQGLIDTLSTMLAARHADLSDRDACFEACWNYIADSLTWRDRVDLDTNNGGWKARPIIAAARRAARR